MVESGRNNFKGLDYQTLAALSFFLQYLKDPNFSHIYLEAPGSIDFKLVFENRQEIICEAKDWATGLSNTEVKNFIKKLMEKKIVSKNDEVLIICNKSNVNLVKQIQNIRSRNKASQEELELWLKLEIWQQSKENLEQAVYTLFCQAIQFWLPEEYFTKFADSLRLKKFHRGSAEGKIYTREEFNSTIESYKLLVKKSGSLFNDRFRTDEQQIDQIISAVEEGGPVYGYSDIAILSLKPNFMFLLLHKLQKKKNINLFAWDEIWQSCKVFLYPTALFDIFKGNLQTKKDREYILTFVQQNLDQLNKFYYETYFEYDLAALLEAIIKKDRSVHQKVLEVIKRQFATYNYKLFYLKASKGRLHTKTALCSSLKLLYNRSTNARKDQIYDFICSTFNLIEDEGDFTLYTPVDIFLILKEYLNHNCNKLLKRRFLALSSELASQYERFYKLKFGNKYVFDGWDPIGAGGAFYKYDYKVFDKHFIHKTLISALRAFNSDTRWKFIFENCVTDAAEVSKERPDFLNRLAIPFILDEYKNGNPEASGILNEFILSPGIPEKAELIYQNLMHGDFTDDQKWDLIAITILRSDTHSPFVEKIVGEMARNGHKKALEQLKKWSCDPTYYAKSSFFDSYTIPNIKGLLNSTRFAVLFSENLITNPYFVQGSRQFDVREVSELLSEMIVQNITDGWRIWNELNQLNNLTANLQLLLTGCLLAILEGENREATETAFVIADVLTSNYKEFVSKFFHREARQLVVQFLEEYAAKTFSDPIRSFNVIKRFINDPDPSKENAADDPTGKSNYHKQILEGGSSILITSVRGKIPWAIQQIVRLGIDECAYDVIKLTRDLTKDENLYVRQQSCVALFRLAAIRYRTEDGKRIIPEECVTHIEGAAFEMLDDPENRRPALQITMAPVFNKLRSIDFDRATKAVNYFVDADLDALRKYLSTIIYFAEFAENFAPEQKLKFRDVLFHLIERDSETKSAIAWEMWKLSKEDSGTGEHYLPKTFPYLQKLVEKYDHNAFKNVYSLIKEHIKNIDHKTELVSTYKKCIEKEFEYLTSHPQCQDNPRLPYLWNNQILEIIFTVSQEDFLSIFKILSQYPRECILGDLGTLEDLLFDIPLSFRKDASDIFENLMQRDPVGTYEKKKQWDEKIKQ